MRIVQRFAVVFLVHAALFPGGRSAQAETAPEAGGPVCQWTFDGALADNAGKDRDDLTPRDVQGQAVSPRAVGEKKLPGVSGAAVALGVESADAEYLTAAVSSDVALGPSYTIEAWIYPTRLSDWNRLVLRWGAAGQYAYHLALHRQRLSLCHGQADGKYIFAEGGRLESGRWYYVVGVARRNDERPASSTLTVYLNGRPVGSSRFDGTIGSPRAEPLGIGDSAGRPSPAARYRGYIDSVTMFNRALSPEEIRARFDHDPRAAKLREFERRQRAIETARRAKLFAKFSKFGVEAIVFAERAPGRDLAGHYYANFGYSCIDPSYWLHGADGGRLVKLNLRTGELAVLLDDPGGAVRDPRVHFSAKKVLFSYRKGGTHHYNLYEIGADGSGLVQITSGDWDDVEPAYLPDGGIIFCSTRCKRYIGCWLAPSATLHRCDADGGNIRMLSSGAFTESTPAVLPDGRVLYTRWEYVNRDPVSFHHLWTMNPDGTSPAIYFGNMHPGGVFIDAVPIPDSDRVLMIHSPAHGRNEHAGYVATVTDRKGPDERSAMRNVSRGADYRDPYPLSDDAFLVARGNHILLMDSASRTEILYTAPMMVHEPRPIVRRPPGEVRPSRVDPAKTTGTLIVGNVYSGRNMDGVEPGSIKRLLVLENLPKPANFHGGGSQPIGHIGDRSGPRGGPRPARCHQENRSQVTQNPRQTQNAECTPEML